MFHSIEFVQVSSAWQDRSLHWGLYAPHLCENLRLQRSNLNSWKNIKRTCPGVISIKLTDWRLFKQCCNLKITMHTSAIQAITILQTVLNPELTWQFAEYHGREKQEMASKDDLHIMTITIRVLAWFCWFSCLIPSMQLIVLYLNKMSLLQWGRRIPKTIAKNIVSFKNQYTCTTGCRWMAGQVWHLKKCPVHDNVFIFSN